MLIFLDADSRFGISELFDIHEMAEDPQVHHNDMIVELEHPGVGTYETTGIPAKLSKTPGKIRSPPPRLGEHTQEVLTELGYDSSAIDELVDKGVTKRIKE